MLPGEAELDRAAEDFGEGFDRPAFADPGLVAGAFIDHIGIAVEVGGVLEAFEEVVSLGEAVFIAEVVEGGTREIERRRPVVGGEGGGKASVKVSRGWGGAAASLELSNCVDQGRRSGNDRRRSGQGDDGRSAEVTEEIRIGAVQDEEMAAGAAGVEGGGAEGLAVE